MKTQHRHLIILLTLLTCLLGMGMETWAANRTVTVSADTGGKWRYRTQPSGGSWSGWSDYITGSQSLTIADNTILNVQAARNTSGYYFVAWYEGTTRRSYSYNYQVTITSDRTFNAKFTTTHYTMTVNQTLISGNGVQLKISNGMDDTSWQTTATVTLEVGAGAQCQLQAKTNDPNGTINSGDEIYFVKWQEGGEDVGDKYYYNIDGMAAAKTMTAVISSQYWSLTYKASAGGTVRIGGVVPYTSPTNDAYIRIGRGGKVVAEAQPESGYILKAWEQTINSVTTTPSNESPYTFNISAITVIKAVFVTAWTGTLLPDATYRLYTETVNGNPNGFRVTSGLDPLYTGGGKTFELVGDLLVSHENAAKSSAIKFYTTAPVMVKGSIKVEKGGLGIRFDNDSGAQGSASYYNHATFQRAPGNTGYFIDVYPKTTTASDCRLTIEGDSGGNLIFDGGCVGMAIDSTTQIEDGVRTYTIDFTHTGGVESKKGFMVLRGGTITIDHLTLRNSWCTDRTAAGIDLDNTSLTTGFACTMRNSLVEWCRNIDYGGGIKFAMSVRGSTFSMTNCEMRYCFTKNGNSGCGGGALRSMGSNLCTLSIKNSVFHHCYTDGNGGVIYWNSALIDPLQLEECTFRNNFSHSLGGAMRIDAGVNIQNCTIKNNTARSSGGAIYYSTFNGGGEGHLNAAGVTHWFPADGVLTLDANTTIKGNKSLIGYSGAIHVFAEFMKITKTAGGYIPIYLNNNYQQFKMKLVMNGATIEDNTALRGGAFTLDRNTDYYGLETDLNYGTIKHNSSTEYGGALYVRQGNPLAYPVPEGGYDYTNPATSATVHLVTQPVVSNIGQSAATSNLLNVTKNEVGNDGAVAYITAGNVNIYHNARIGGSTDDANKTVRGHGGCAYMNGGTLTMYGGIISYNSVTRSSDYGGQGGAFYVRDGLVEVKGGTITQNVASFNGGAFYIFCKNATDLVKINSSVATTTISNNQSGNYGGAIFIDKGSLQLEGSTTTVTGNQAALGGGGIYVHNGSVSISSATISNNTAVTDNGGGIYAEGAVTITGATISGNHADDATSGLGGGIYAVASGKTITVQSSSTINGNTAKKGAGVYASSGTMNLTGSTLQNNEAAQDGGGIYAFGGTVNFSSGSVQNNTATQNGGGIYIPSTGSLNISGTASITGNNVTSGQGGGVYQGGNMLANSSSLNVSSNTKGSAKATSPNNVYLPHGQTIKVGSDISTSVNLGIYTERTVTGAIADGGNDGNDIPVLSADAGNEGKLNAIFNAMLTGTSNIVDDRNIHHPKYVQGQTTLYFGVDSFDFYYDSDFSNPIHDARELYQYMCWVNGINGYSQHYGDTGELAADIDLSDIIYWTPIGVDDHPFTGTFEGNGYVIDGLHIVNPLMNNVGLFGTTQGATIQNTFVTGCNYSKSTTGNLGCIVGDMKGGTIANSLGAGTLVGAHGSCVVGGLAGRVEQNSGAAATIHSSSAMADMTGYTLGGLVGNLTSGCNLYNSFANPKFTYSGSANAYYVGGLVAINSGTVQNCYVRFTRESSFANAAKFGQIVGQNNSSVTVCYHPTTYNASISSALVNDGSVSSTIYGDVVAPYLYNHSNDNLVGSTTDETLCNELNDWVATNNSTSGRPTCAEWKRTTAGGTAYSATAGDINGDYPIHQYKNASNEDLYTCVASPDGITLDYAASLDAMLTRHASNATINLYVNDNTSKSTGANEVVYIDENVSLLQSNTISSIEAYTCQTLKTASSSRWHFLSSSLSNSGIGFTYAHDAGFSWDPDPCGLGFTGGDDYCIMPTDIITKGGIRAFDFYCFYEPEYHWINFKRNSNSHWHMNAATVPINYANESTLTPGKGYLVSVNQEQLLQNRGTLNNGNVSYGLSYTLSNAWAELLGYNLIGNPYQSYLDFSLFLNDGHGTTNTDLFESSGKSATEYTYAVYDSETGGYLQYKAGSSKGSRSLSGYINPHQGFLVRVKSTGKSARFTNYMRSNDGTPNFRGEQPAFPVINLMVTDSEGDSDVAVLELSRDNDEGAEKLRANTSKGWLYLHHNNEDYAILFRDTVTDYQPLWFEASEAGTYTLKWNTANVEFDELTLVDNITGTKTDMLQHDSYSFEADPSQYASRFKLVIGSFKPTHGGEGEDPEPVEGPFAYMSNGMLVVNGEGVLEMVDVLGRIVRTEELHGSQSTIGLPQGAAGVYVLRLTGRDGVRTQKIVIR